MSRLFEPVLPADIEWRNGMPYSRNFQDIYFSAPDGLAESRHVFIEGNRLVSRWAMLAAEPSPHFTIAETGFGTGLNFLLTWSLWRQYAPPNARLHYYSCEKYPLLKADLCRALSLWPEMSKLSELLLTQWPELVPGWHTFEFCNERISLTLMIGDALKAYESLLQSGHSEEEARLPTPKMNAWFLDGFAPSRNEDMWTPALCACMAMLSKKNTSLATFSVARSVRDALTAAGFTLHKGPGYGNKREMLSGHMEFSPKRVTYTKPNTAWHYAYPSHTKSSRAIIVGGGLAGAFLAYFLANRGWKVTLLDKESDPGLGASGNTQAVTFPHFSAYDSPLSRLMLQAWRYSCFFYHHFCDASVAHALNGLIDIAENSIVDAALIAFLQHHPELGLFLQKEAISRLAGVPVHSAGYYFPQGGWINSPQLCKKLIHHPDILWKGEQNVSALHYDQNEWTVNDETAPVVILAMGHRVHTFPQTEYLPIKGIRGQMSIIPETADTSVRIPICGSGHILSPHAGKIAFGASYDLMHSQAFCTRQDDEKNRQKIQNMPIQLGTIKAIAEHWSGVRAVCPDYMPLVGPVVKESAFIEHYASLQKNSRAYINAHPELNYPGLYAFAGFGSRGLVTIPYCARWLAGMLSRECSILPRDLQQALSPSRFIFRQIIRNKNICQD